MIKKKKLIRNIILLSVIILIIASFSYASLTPLQAHRRSERTANYGPSVIIKSQSMKGQMFYLCKYDKWYSLDTVKRGFLGLWYAGDQVLGKENDAKEALDYAWSGNSSDKNHMIYKFYGEINDKKIKAVTLELEYNGQTKSLEQKKLYDNMFMFIWEEDNSYKYIMKAIKGYDNNSNLIFQKALY
jgi:hypothetical protein